MGGGEDEDKELLAKVGGGAPKVLQDGTYATETALTSGAAAKLEAVKAAAKPAMRGVYSRTALVGTTTDFWFVALILNGDFYTASVLASTLTKLVLRFNQITSDQKASHALRAEVRSVSFTPKDSLTLGMSNNRQCSL